VNPKLESSLRAVRYKTIDGLQIRYATNDNRNGDPILLLSPLPESILAFLPTWDVVSELGPVVAVDLPSFGLSETRPDLKAPEP
jgi:pimeloyl-ACP methyl ester carboxylesterase